MQVVVLAHDALEVDLLPGAVDRPVGVEIDIGHGGHAIIVLIQAEISGRDAAAVIQRSKSQAACPFGAGVGGALDVTHIRQAVLVGFGRAKLFPIYIVKRDVHTRLRHATLQVGDPGQALAGCAFHSNVVGCHSEDISLVEDALVIQRLAGDTDQVIARL